MPYTFTYEGSVTFSQDEAKNFFEKIKSMCQINGKLYPCGQVEFEEIK